MNERKQILWLASWYPNKYDVFDGDFIQRHARAAALYDDIHVIVIKTHEQQKAIERFWTEKSGLTEQIIYLPKQHGIIGKWNTYQQWRTSYQDAVTEFVTKHKPHYIHVHVPWKGGLIALWAKRKFNVPYLVTEHWGIYNTLVTDNIQKRSFLFRRLLKKIYKEAKTFVSVSRYVGEGVNRTLVKKDFVTVQNVVDTTLFFPSANKPGRFRFLHVSNMVTLKNVEGILSAFQSFSIATGVDAELVLIGNRDEYYPVIADNMGLLNESVFFRGEIPYEQVAVEMQSAHVFILNSDIENSPCVISEALCCGLPVIATNVGGIPELLSEINSVLVAPRNSEDLLEAIKSLYQNYDRYDINAIASNAAGIASPVSIGKQFHSLYGDF